MVNPRNKKRHPRASEDPTFGSDHAWILACAGMTVLLPFAV